MRVAVLSDIHGNLAALQAVLRVLPPVDDLWCLGDIVGYGPCPNECLEQVVGWRPGPGSCSRVGQGKAVGERVMVAGNHDWAAVGRLDSSSFNRDAAAAISWTSRQLNQTGRRAIEAWPERQVRGEWTIVHGSPRFPIWEYLIDCYAAELSFQYFSTRYALVGHTHVPAIFTLSPGDHNEEVRCLSQPVVLDQPLPLGEGRVIVNPGSVGQPRDGDPRASYLVLDEDGGTVEYHRVTYDIERTQAEMRRVGLPPRLAERLNFGL